MHPRMFLSAILVSIAFTANAATPLWFDLQQEAAANQNNGNYEEAARLHKLSLDEMQKDPMFPDEGMAQQMSNLSSALMALEKYDEALRYSGQALELATRVNKIDLQLLVMINHGNALALVGRSAVAEEICQEALAIMPVDFWMAEGIQASSYMCLARASLNRGNFDKGDEYYEIAHDILAASPRTRIYPNIIKSLEARYAKFRAQAEKTRSER